MHLVLTTVVFIGLVSAVAAQCTGNDHPNCASWKTNGYCTNAGTPLEQRKLYCGVTCGLCNRDGTQTAAGGGSVVPPCNDANANCAAWQLQSPPFCTNPSYSTAMKKQYCCKTCSAPANPTTDCAVIYQDDATFMNTGPVVAEEAINITPLTKVFIKNGCSLSLSDSPQPAFTDVAGSPFLGTGAFVTLTGASTSAMAFKCTCPP